MKKEKLQNIYQEYKELESKLSDPDIISNQEQYKKIAKRYASVKSISQLYEKYNSLLKEKQDLEQILEQENNKEFLELADKELVSLNEKIEEIEEKIQDELLEDDPYSDRDIILEIRAGTGGDEATLFVADIFGMYEKYAFSKGFNVEIIDSKPSQIGGFKEIIFSVKGKNVYKIFKHESGIHRVQRVPATESSGRIHTSAVSVVVLPEAEEVDIQINPKDLRIDVFRSSGPGGQSVNTADSAVRITHIPTEIVVVCQDERSQLKNKNKAMRILRARLLDKAREEKKKEKSDKRKLHIGSGDRSEKIRTYNYPQGRVTDHRINFTLHKLDQIMDGDLDTLFKKLQEEEKKIKKSNL